MASALRAKGVGVHVPIQDQGNTREDDNSDDIEDDEEEEEESEDGDEVDDELANDEALRSRRMEQSGTG